MQEKFLTEKEVAELTGLALSTLRNDRSLSRKLFPYVKVGKSVRYSLTDVLAAMERRKIRLTG